jgi:Na+/H+-dicarboxylate symporter
MKFNNRGWQIKGLIVGAILGVIGGLIITNISGMAISGITGPAFFQVLLMTIPSVATIGSTIGALVDMKNKRKINQLLLIVSAIGTAIVIYEVTHLRFYAEL